MRPDLNPLTDEIIRVDAEATLDRLARRYGGALARFFERRIGLGTDVADLVQEVFLRMARRGDLSKIEKLESYLFSAAASTLKDRARRDRVRRVAAHDQFDEAVHGDSDFSADRVLEGRQAVARLDEALRELPTRTRDVFVLRAFEERKMADVAHVLGISTRAAEKHFARALAHAAKALEGWRD